MLTFQDVFVPGGFPRHTYNPRIDLKLEAKVAEALHNLCRLVTVTGQTKSGKTVLVRRVFPPENSVWIDGGIVSAEEDFWSAIISQLDVFQSTSCQTSTETSGTIGGKASASANFIVAKGEGEVSAEIEQGTSRRCSPTSRKASGDRCLIGWPADLASDRIESRAS